MKPYLITELDEYEYCIGRGFFPLLDVKNFNIEINLRVSIQKQFFGHTILGRGNIPQGNDRFYRYMWEKKPHYCEECMRPLEAYSSIWISHILTRGANPEIAHDTRNINILCHKHHDQWETGDRTTMRIYRGNLKTIELLKNDYQKLNKHENKGWNDQNK
jgi:hypothetical protein